MHIPFYVFIYFLFGKPSRRHISTNGLALLYLRNVFFFSPFFFTEPLSPPPPRGFTLLEEDFFFLFFFFSLNLSSPPPLFTPYPLPLHLYAKMSIIWFRWYHDSVWSRQRPTLPRKIRQKRTPTKPAPWFRFPRASTAEKQYPRVYTGPVFCSHHIGPRPDRNVIGSDRTGPDWTCDRIGSDRTVTVTVTDQISDTFINILSNRTITDDRSVPVLTLVRYIWRSDSTDGLM